MSDIELALFRKLPQFNLDVNLRVPNKGITALVGQSGSGKSTLLRCIAGLDSRCTGLVRVNGESWLDSDSNICKPVHQRRIGYVFQDAYLFPHLKVQANLDYAWQRTKKNQQRFLYNTVLEWLNLGALLKRYPGQLSGGERQRVAIARALLTSPSLLLFDEPLSALDEHSKSEIMPYLERLQCEFSMPVIYVTHAVREVVRLADYLLSLQEGRVLSQGVLVEQMTQLESPFVRSPDHGCVINGTFGGYDAQDHLSRFDFVGGQLLVAHSALKPGQQARVYIPAADVSIALSKQVSSILNILPARIDTMVPLGEAQCLLRLAVGDRNASSFLLARITQRSLRQLGLHAGMSVYAQIKSVALMRAQH